MFRYLRDQGHDTNSNECNRDLYITQNYPYCFPTPSTELMMAIEDIIIKTIIAGEVPICSSLCYQPYHGNCFGQSTAAIL